MAAGEAFTCALVTPHVATHTITPTHYAVQCFGNNRNGQLGYGLSGRTLVGRGLYRTDFPLPEVAIRAYGSAEQPLQLAVGGSHACVVIQGGPVRCWGHNRYGQLGTGNGLFDDVGTRPHHMPPQNAMLVADVDRDSQTIAVLYPPPPPSPPLPPLVGEQVTQPWITVFGEEEREVATAAAADRSNVYVAGTANTSLPSAIAAQVCLVPFRTT